MKGILINQQTFTNILYLDVKRWQTLYFSTFKYFKNNLIV